MDDLRDPWLVAAWPGMGAVAHLAATHLIRQLGAQPHSELAAGDFFEVGKVETRQGLLLPVRQPRTVLNAWRNPAGGRDLVVLVGEQQPQTRLHAFCASLLEAVGALRVERVYTFAAMGTLSPPESPARVFAAATGPAALEEVRLQEVELVREGEIGGMNGVFLAEAAQRGFSGACLLGELPYFASGVPNPKAAAAVLRVFSGLAGISFDIAELERQGEEVSRQLASHVRRLEDAARELRRGAGEAPGETPEDWPAPEREDELAHEDLERIEALFAEAQRDRSRALALKSELDRLGAFRRYEDRFLDLFKRGE